MLSDYEPTVQAFLQEEAPAVGFSYERYRSMLEANELSEEDFPIVAETPQLPPDVFMANPNTLSEESVGEMSERIQQNDDALLRAIREPGDTEYADIYRGAEISATDDSAYDYMREAYAAAGFEDLSKALEDL
jgi:ABC-type phosphate/phosphonate transport system substrate-binding protein